jgi:phytoene desaturase
MHDLVYKPGLSWSEFFDARLFRSVFQLGVFQSYAAHVRKYFSDPRLILIMEFPVLFLGGTPASVPALYSLMAYAGLAMGTWYPMGGMHQIVEAMHRLAVELGVQFHFGEEVQRIHVNAGKAEFVKTTRDTYPASSVIASADYHHVEQQLLDPEHRMYAEKYWSSRVLAPSAMIYYLGVNRKVPRLRHHNLFFDASYEIHADAIYGRPRVPEKPLFYLCAPSVTDASVAPEGCENLFILVPMSTELEDTEERRQECFKKVMERAEEFTGVPIRRHLVHYRSYAMQDFKADYHALRGNAYGLANTLLQTATFKPRIRSRKVKNLFFAGQLTVPGPGVPPALISGEIAAGLILKSFKKHTQPYATTTL